LFSSFLTLEYNFFQEEFILEDIQNPFEVEPNRATLPGRYVPRDIIQPQRFTRESVINTSFKVSHTNEFKMVSFQLILNDSIVAITFAVLRRFF
jgi:hypothetical protein